jgi:hypothetical protein
MVVEIYLGMFRVSSVLSEKFFFKDAEYGCRGTDFLSFVTTVMNISFLFSALKAKCTLLLTHSHCTPIKEIQFHRTHFLQHIQQLAASPALYLSFIHSGHPVDRSVPVSSFVSISFSLPPLIFALFLSHFPCRIYN